MKTARTATIPNGASVSNVIDINIEVPVGFIAPAAWTTAALNVEVSMDGNQWSTPGLFDSTGAAASSWSSLTAGAFYAFDPVQMLAWNHLRLRSGTYASQVNQGAERAFIIASRRIA